MIEGHYCQGGMPGRRWTVWGRAVGAFEYRTHGLASERSYSTREIEATLSAVGLLVTR
jgi:hypothetical protein